MKKLILAAAVAGAVLLSSAAQAQTTPEGYQLQQVLMMSRHNLRAPLANNGSVLEQSTPNQWPEWDVPGGQLTTKGGVLEIYMGHYMREWLAELGMVTSGECPTPDTVYTYANSLQRTVATAQFFITGAFPGCDIRHCCKVSDEAAFCLIQRPYISKTLLTRRISPRGSP